MRAPMMEIGSVITDQQWAGEWSDQLENLLVEVGEIFPRVEVRRRAADFVRGLLGPISRKNGWQLAEYVGDEHAWGLQHLLARAVWEPDALRDFVRRYVLDGLAMPGAGPGGAGVLVIDETGFEKRGRSSAGVARQYTGTAGAVVNCQIGVMAAWATAAGQAMIDRELYLPKEWTQDRDRRAGAHVPGERVFATKPRLAEQMIDRVLPDLPPGRVWVAADEVYGRDGAFRSYLEERGLPYAVTIQANQKVLDRPGFRHVARLVARIAAESDWLSLPAGPSQLDTRTWQWWVRRLPDPQAGIGADDRQAAADPGCWARWVIARRRPQTPADRDYYLAWGPPGTPIEELVAVPGARWRVEEAIKLGKSACGLADYEVRSYHGWYRHITLAQLAAAFLAVQQAATAVAEDDLHGDGDGTATHTGGSRPVYHQHLHALQPR
ncbi:IS701 family transposase [Acrocarpospora macrocephala]|nr:IS701 family transposase [Acrocarpospora macrocephala]